MTTLQRTALLVALLSSSGFASSCLFSQLQTDPYLKQLIDQKAAELDLTALKAFVDEQKERITEGHFDQATQTSLFVEVDIEQASEASDMRTYWNSELKSGSSRVAASDIEKEIKGLEAIAERAIDMLVERQRTILRLGQPQNTAQMTSDEIFRTRVLNAEAVEKEIKNRGPVFRKTMLDFLAKYLDDPIDKSEFKAGIDHRYRFLGFKVGRVSYRMAFTIASESPKTIFIEMLDTHENFYEDFRKKVM